MSIALYEHNQKAYAKALHLMEETGKAAIVHPTGTGKSFIGFKLAEEHSQQRVCWLSPSEYIFKTQIANLKAVFPYCSLQNVQFYTYAKLMLMDEVALAEIQPDYIVFDEFHRCGAAQWGQGVQRLLRIFPQANMLGLSATNIRYLDNQRDMADELFDGNVASEMTLGEAIARNILLPPTYVISVYSYQKELEKYQQRIKSVKQRGVRESAEKYLEALRRALANADGLDVIFKKHMPNKKSKYIAFCASYEHMQEMIAHVPSWFSKVDQEPQVYSVYSEEAAAEQEFINFQNDTSEHIKLLFCINMLNEGVHLDDVDGVILFRPTVSPIIYKQQIGRALSANKGKQPIIFDIVNNFENLYSIGSIQEELNTALHVYHNLDKAVIVQESFQVIDEVRDCRRLFKALQETLSTSWNVFYAAARKYYEFHGHLDIPKRYKTPNHLSLGAWITTQRRVKQGKASGILTEEQIAQLDAIGMIWNNPLELRWKKNFTEAKQYFATHGNLDVPVGYVTDEGFSLGKWIYQVRQLKAQGKLTTKQIAQLDHLGMIWDKFQYLWEKNYQAAREYYRVHGHLEVSCNYVTPEGFSLGRWIAQLRQIRKGNTRGAAKLTAKQIARLDAIGMHWSNQHDCKWEQMYDEAKRYVLVHGNLDVSSSYVTERGVKLGKWLYKQKITQEQASLSAERVAKLNALGMVWAKDSWEERYLWAKQYYEKFGHLKIPHDYKTKTGLWLGKWLYEQRMTYKGKYKGRTLAQEQIARLEAIGMNWLSPAEQAWEKNYAVALQYFSQHGDLDVSTTYCTADGVYLGRWLLKQRSNYKKNKAITGEQIKRLEAIGMNWGLPKMQEQCLSRAAGNQEETGAFL